MSVVEKENAESQGIMCPVCHSKDTYSFVNIADVPVHCNLLYTSHDKALGVQKADINLAFCRFCEHVFNYLFDPDRMGYDQDYENSLHFSPHFQEYAHTLATKLIDRYDLNRKNIIEIGCGDGEFLALLCELGLNRGWGFDPSSQLRHNDCAADKHINIIKDYYSDKYSDYRADLIICRHVLEHIKFPRDFLGNVRSVSRDCEGGIVVYFEVPNVAFTLRDLGIWDLIYEHCSYFSAKSFVYLFNSCGFQVRECTEVFDDQFLSIECLLSNRANDVSLVDSSNFDSLKLNVENFANAFHNKIKKWKKEIEQFKAKDKKAVIWGAGSKGVTFLNALGIDSEIEYVIDINPKKHGNYVAGTGQKIAPPSFLPEYFPDYIIVMNPIYQNEIKKMMREINVTSEIMLA